MPGAVSLFIWLLFIYLLAAPLSLNSRHQGIENLADVKAAYMEADGSISIIKEKKSPVEVGG